MRERVADRLPLGRELREGIEHGALRLVGRVHEQRHGRLHCVVPRERQHVVRVGWALDEHGIGAQLLERGQERAGRARPVVTDAEDVEAHSTSMQLR